MAANTLLFTLLSGLVLLAIVVLVLRIRRWRRGPTELRGYTTFRPSREGDAASAGLTAALRDPAAWSVGFLLLVLVAVAGTLAAVGAMPVPESVQPLVTTVLLVLAAVVLGGFVFAGVYSSVRSRGYGSAPAAGLGTLVVGFLALLVVVVNLFVGA